MSSYHRQRRHLDKLHVLSMTLASVAATRLNIGGGARKCSSTNRKARAAETRAFEAALRRHSQVRPLLRGLFSGVPRLDIVARVSETLTASENMTHFTARDVVFALVCGMDKGRLSDAAAARDVLHIMCDAAVMANSTAMLHLVMGEGVDEEDKGADYGYDDAETAVYTAVLRLPFTKIALGAARWAEAFMIGCFRQVKRDGA